MTYKSYLKRSWSEFAGTRSDVASVVSVISALAGIGLITATIPAIGYHSFTPYLVVLLMVAIIIAIPLVGWLVYSFIYWLIMRKEM